MSAYFTIYAYEALKGEINAINHLRFLFGEPCFIQSLDPDKTEEKAFKIEDVRPPSPCITQCLIDATGGRASREPLRTSGNTQESKSVPRLVRSLGFFLYNSMPRRTVRFWR